MSTSVTSRYVYLLLRYVADSMCKIISMVSREELPAYSLVGKNLS